MTQEDEKMWGSHLPALLTAIGASTGPVLEVGIGHFSTPALHAICGALGRKLRSIEASPEWAAQFRKYQTLDHEIIQCEYSDFLSAIEQRIDHVEPWGVAFIDHSPGGKSRADAFRILAKVSAYVVVHDYHLENEEHIAPLLTGFKTVRVFNSYQPPTLVASMKYELPQSADQL